MRKKMRGWGVLVRKAKSQNDGMNKVEEVKKQWEF